MFSVSTLHIYFGQFVHVFLSNTSAMSFEVGLFVLQFFGPGWPPSLFWLLVANTKFGIPLLCRITFIPFAKDKKLGLFHEITFQFQITIGGTQQVLYLCSMCS